jgi:hypothetical protein
MYPDAITSAVQTGQTGLRPQGASMNWKKLLSDCFFKFGWYYSALILLRWMRSSHLSYMDFVECAFVAAPFSLGSVGYDELGRSGRQKLRYALFPCILIVSSLVFVVILREDLPVSWCLVAFSLFGLPFPLAIFLNRNKKESSFQTHASDAD